MPIDRATDFNVAVRAWAAVVGVTLSRTEMFLLKMLYQKRCFRSDNPLPPMVEATTENVASMFQMLERMQKKRAE